MFNGEQPQRRKSGLLGYSYFGPANETSIQVFPRNWYYNVSKWLAASTMLIAVLVLVGWIFDIPRLTSFSSTWHSMKVTTAVGLLLTASSLLLLNPQFLHSESDGRTWRFQLGRLAAVGAGVLGIGTLIIYVFRLEGRISHPDLMAPATALSFMLLAAAVLSAKANGYGQYTAQSLTAVVVFIGTLAVIGYLFHAQLLYTIGPYSSMAVHTAGCFVLLSIAFLFLWPDRGFMRIATALTSGGIMLQQMLPLTVVMVVAIGWLHLVGEYTGWFDDHVGLTLVAGLSLAGFSIILWSVAHILNRIDVAGAVNEHRLIARLKMIDERKTQLLYSVSHEYRTPLTGMVGISRLLMNRIDGPLTAEQEKQVRLIHTGAQQLLALVDTMLDLDRMKAGKFEATMCYCTAASILEGIHTAAGLFPVRPSVSLIIQEPKALPAFTTDPMLLYRILYNLVHNAAKYTEQGTVEIRADAVEEGRAVCFVVRDSGIGIAGEDLNHIFEEFVQLRHPLQQRARGQGLGLALCKQLADLLGASIAVESRLGEGSTFSVTMRCDQRKADG